MCDKNTSTIEEEQKLMRKKTTQLIVIKGKVGVG